MRAESRQLAGLAFLCLAGCTVGPEYQSPSHIGPEAWQAGEKAANRIPVRDAAALQNWWKTFHDPELNHLMKQARRDNLDLKTAAARILEARAELSANQSDLLPTISGDARAYRLGNPAPGLLPPATFNFFQLGFDAMWEVDAFGRLRRQVEGASARAESATETYRQAWVSLSAEVARCYTEYRALQNQLRITQANLKSQRHSLGLTEMLYREGVGTRHDIVRARALTESTSARLPQLESRLTATQHQLEVLLAIRPGSLHAELQGPGSVPTGAGRELLLSPAETLRRRPDIRSAERGLAAATAQQGVAKAELFPKISVAAFLGIRNTDLENLFRSSAFSWSSGSSLLQPIFNLGRIRAGIALADARQQEAALVLEKTVLEALREAETALTAYLKEETRRQTLARSVADQRESVRLAELKYREGISSFLDVLDAERALYLQETELADSEAQATIALIALYKALGGDGGTAAGEAEEQPGDP